MLMLRTRHTWALDCTSTYIQINLNKVKDWALTSLKHCTSCRVPSEPCLSCSMYAFAHLKRELFDARCHAPGRPREIR